MLSTQGKTLTSYMLSKISSGNRFLITSVLLFTFFSIGLKLFFANNHLTIANNASTSLLVSAIFLAISMISALCIFLPRPLKSVLTAENIVNTALLILLFATLFNTTTSAIVTFLFLVFTISMAIVKKSKFSLHPFFGVLMAYYGFQLIGLLWTIDIDEGIKFIDKGLSFIIIPLGFSLLSITLQQRDRVLLFFIRFLIVFLLMGMLGYLFQVYFHDLSFWVGFGTEKVYFPLSPELDTVYEQILVGSGYGHPAYTSLIFVTMIPVSFYLWSKEKSNKLKLSNTELFAFLFLSAIVIFIIKSRIGFLMYPFGLFLSVLFLLRKSKVLPYILFSLIFLAVIAAIMIYKNRTDFSFMTDPIRENIYSYVVNYIKAHPLTGTGTGSMRLELIPTVNQAVNAHNQFIGELFHLGIGGLLIFIILITRILHYGIIKRNYILLYFILIFTFLMMTEMPLAIQKGVSAFTLFCCLFARPDWEIEAGNYAEQINITPKKA